MYVSKRLQAMVLLCKPVLLLLRHRRHSASLMLLEMASWIGLVLLPLQHSANSYSARSCFGVHESTAWQLAVLQQTQMSFLLMSRHLASMASV